MEYSCIPGFETAKQKKKICCCLKNTIVAKCTYNTFRRFLNYTHLKNTFLYSIFLTLQVNTKLLSWLDFDINVLFYPSLQRTVNFVAWCLEQTLTLNRTLFPSQISSYLLVLFSSLVQDWQKTSSKRGKSLSILRECSALIQWVMLISSLSDFPSLFL